MSMSMSMDMGMEPASHDHDQGPNNSDGSDGGMVMSATFTTGTTVTLFFSSWKTVSLASYLLTLFFLFALAFFNRFLGALRFQLDHYHPHHEQNDGTQTGPPRVPILGPPRLRHFLVKDRLSPLPRYMELNKSDDANNSTHSAHPSAPMEEDNERDMLVSGDDSSSTRRSSCFRWLFRVWTRLWTWTPSESWSWRRDGLRSLLEGVRAFIGYILMLAVMTFNVGIFCAVIAGIILGELVLGRYTQQSAGWQDGACHD